MTGVLQMGSFRFEPFYRYNSLECRVLLHQHFQMRTIVVCGKARAPTPNGRGDISASFQKQKSAT